MVEGVIHGEPGSTASVRSEGSADDTTPPEGASRGRTAPVEVRPGACIGRYTVRGVLGAGGMGQVFAAYDPELGRNVAIKLIRPGVARSPSRAQARLLSEARALARLHHPSVVMIHDVGTHGDQIFLAMELVEGETLTEWLSHRGRGWREILATFCGAGRGLVSAHGLGIVHRDVKPDNIIVGAERVVVIDFGLARDDADAGDDAGCEAGASTLGPRLTLTGERVGTRHYMAPEQAAGGPVTARADQFSFCVALEAALAGDAQVPARIIAAVRRGRALDPGARWPSMAALLAELTRDRRAIRRRVAVLAVVTALAATAAWGVLTPRAGDLCPDPAARLDGVWDAARATAVQAAFAATALPYRDVAWREVRARLDRYADRWVDLHLQTCRATRVEGRQSDTLMDLRMACLDRRRAVLGALTGTWAGGMDADSLAAATSAAERLPRLEDCNQTRALLDLAVPSDPVTVVRVAFARAQIDRVHALDLAYRWSEARTAAALARDAAEATGWSQVRAEAALAEGRTLMGLSEPRAEERLREAMRLALEARDDGTAARAIVDLIASLAEDQQSAGRALLVADLADGLVARAEDPELRARLLHNRGQALVTEGKYDAARAEFEAALAGAPRAAPDLATLATSAELARTAHLQGHHAEARARYEQNLSATTALLGAEHPRIAAILNNLAMTVDAAGDHKSAEVHYRRALAIKEKLVGPDTAATALALNNLAIVESELGRLDEERALFERALAIRERILGPEHPYVATTLGNLAVALRKQGHVAEARALLERSLAIKLKAYGPGHPSVAYALTELGTTLAAQGDLAGALDHAQRALELRRQALGADHPATLRTMGQVARALQALGRCPGARPLARTALAGLERAQGADRADAAEPLAVIAECDLAEGHAEAAAAGLERALTILDQAQATAADHGSVRWPLARALWARGRRDAALAAARAASVELGDRADLGSTRAAVRAWLAHPH